MISHRCHPKFLELCFEVKNSFSSLVGCMPPLGPGLHPSGRMWWASGVWASQKVLKSPYFFSSQMQCSAFFQISLIGWGVKLIRRGLWCTYMCLFSSNADPHILPSSGRIQGWVSMLWDNGGQRQVGSVTQLPSWQWWLLTQLLPFHGQSLPCSLPWSLGSFVWNMLITQGVLFGASKSQKFGCKILPFPSSYRKLWLPIAAPLYLSPNLPPWLMWFAHLDALMHRPLRCARVRLVDISWIVGVPFVFLRGEI